MGAGFMQTVQLDKRQVRTLFDAVGESNLRIGRFLTTYRMAKVFAKWFARGVRVDIETGVRELRAEDVRLQLQTLARAKCRGETQHG